MITKAQLKNAERICLLSETFGHLPFNENGQTTNQVLNLSIPCAVLVKAGIVTGVDKDTNDGITDGAVADVERHCRIAVRLATEKYGNGWWNDEANKLLGIDWQRRDELITKSLGIGPGETLRIEID